MVVVEALGDVEDPLARQPDALEGDLEVALVRLVATDLLGGHDPVEVDAEAGGRAREQVVVAVGDDAEPEPPVEAGQGVGGVGECRPVADRIGEGRHLGRASGSTPRPAATPRTPIARIVAVGQVRPGLGRRLDGRVGLEQLVVRPVDAVRRRGLAGGPPGCRSPSR